MEREISSNCLAGNVQESSCVQISKDVEGYDIKKGDSLDWAISQLASSTGTEEVPAEEITNLLCLTGNGNSLCASKVVYRSVTLINSSGALSWNMDEIKNSLPSGYTPLYARTSINSPELGYPVYDGKGFSGNTNISLDMLPVTVDFQIRIESPCGQLLMKATKNIDSLKNGVLSESVLMSIDYFGNEYPRSVSQSQLNSLLIEQVCRMIGRINVLEQENVQLRETVNSLSNG